MSHTYLLLLHLTSILTSSGIEFVYAFFVYSMCLYLPHCFQYYWLAEKHEYLNGDFDWTYMLLKTAQPSTHKNASKTTFESMMCNGCLPQWFIVHRSVLCMWECKLWLYLPQCFFMKCIILLGKRERKYRSLIRVDEGVITVRVIHAKRL